MYQVCNNEDEFEPRVTPKPSSKLDDFTVPSVPEVSLIFDKPVHSKTTQHVGINSRLAESRSTTHESNGSLNVNGSYAAWKEQNYARKSSRVHNSTSPQVQFGQDYMSPNHSREGNVTPTVNQSKGKNCVRRRDSYNDSPHEQEESRRNADLSNKYNPEDDRARIESNRSARAQYNDRVRRASLPTTPRVPKQCISSDNCVVNENEYSPLSYERKLASQDPKQQKVSYNNGSITDPSMQTLPMNPNGFQRNEIQLPHYLGQQYPYFNMNGYPFAQLHPYAVPNTDNQETVKNLLQIINSQNEQIKSLQTQVDRLLKMQEENMRERKRCTCSLQSQYSNQLHTSATSNDTVDVPNYISVPENAKNGAYQRELSANGRRDDSKEEDESRNQNELILADVQSKKGFVEQKVSIGVMTSFEFTVQNNPYALDVGDYKENDDKQENGKACHSIRDTNESLRRYKNSFTRMSGAQLENIVEDSESYMSSSQQQSSNLNASTSVKDLERQTYVDTRRNLDNRKLESPKLSKGATMKLSETESNARRHLGKEGEIEERRTFETARTPMMQRDSEYVVSDNRNFKANTCNGNEYGKINVQCDNDSFKSSNSLNNSGYYKDCRKEGQITGSKRSNCIEDSLILNGVDLRINERPPPTPEPSIHVEMNEYSSDDDSEKVKPSEKVGWTFYNNVLGQVNQLLQNSAIAEDQQQNQMKMNHNERNETENKAALDNVKVATLEQLKKLGISLSENPEANELNSSNKMAFDLSFYPRLDYQTNMTQATSAVNETNTSMHMKALALKYLTDEQLAELAIQRQGSASVKHLMVSNMQGTNMSFATMRYLERYQLLPGKNNACTEDISKVQNEVPPRVDLKPANSRNSPKTLRFPFNQTPRTTCPSKILDISTLKQQPKLL